MTACIMSTKSFAAAGVHQLDCDNLCKHLLIFLCWLQVSCVVNLVGSSPGMLCMIPCCFVSPMLSVQAFGSFPNHDYIHRDHDYLHETASPASSQSGNDSDTSSQASPNSRLRRSTFPVDFEGAQSQEISSSQGSPMSQPGIPQNGFPERPERQLGAHQNGMLRKPDAQPKGQPEGQSNGQPEGQHKGQHQEAAPADGQQQDPAPGSKEDGFNSDPEHSSRMLRLKATHLLGSERITRSPNTGSPPRKGIRRAASEAQIMQKYSLRSGNAQQIGSFGSHTSDATRSFDEYLRSHRSPSPSPKSRSRQT